VAQSASTHRGEFRLALLLPALSVAVVGGVLLGPGRTTKVIGARIRGGPTVGASMFSCRIEVLERLDDLERPLRATPITVETTIDGLKQVSRGVLDDEGALAVAQGPMPRPITGPVHVELWLADRPEPIVDTTVTATEAAWRDGAKHRGGWVTGKRSSDGTVIRAAAGRGVFAVPYADPFWVSVSRGDVPVAAAGVHVTADGADVATDHAVTDSNGRAVFSLRPREHSVAVTIAATGSDDARLEVSLSVVPGALHATLLAGAVLIESPIVRDRAYVALVDDTERIASATVWLTPASNDPSGASRGVFSVPLPATGPLWAVVSSEPDFHSASLVGWPLRVSGEPALTFDVADVLLFDGVDAAVRREASRARHVRTYGGLFAVLALALSAALLVQRTARARRRFEAELDPLLDDRDATQRVVASGGGSAWVVVTALLCIALAAVLVFVLATYR
jgi:hypothetical protein